MWVLVLLGVVLAVLVVMADLGLIWNAQGELRTAADAAALAAAHAWAEKLAASAPPGLSPEARQEVYQEAARYVAEHAGSVPLCLLPNPDNDVLGDVVFGFYHRSSGFTPARQQELASPWLNAVRVTVCRDGRHGNAAGLVFGPLFGWSAAEVHVSAVAVLERHILGFQCTDGQAIPVVPIAILSDPSGQAPDCWEAQVAQADFPGGLDQDTATPATVRIRLFLSPSTASLAAVGLGAEVPGPSPSAVTGNACVVQIGTQNWSEAVRQMATGIWPQDLAGDDFAGRLVIDPAAGFRPVLAWTSAPGLNERELADLWAALSGLQQRGEVRIWPLYAGLLPKAEAQADDDRPIAAVNGFVAARILRLELRSGGAQSNQGTYLELTLQPQLLVTRTAIPAAHLPTRNLPDDRIENPYLTQPNRYVVRIQLAQ